MQTALTPIILVALSFSCNFQRENNPNAPRVDCIPTGSVVLSADSLISVTRTAQISTDYNDPSFQLHGAGKVYRIDLKNNKIFQTFDIPKEGPGGISSKSEFDAIVTFDDNTFLYAHNLLQKIFQLKGGVSNAVFATSEDDGQKLISTKYSRPIKNDRLALFPAMANFSKREPHFAYLKADLLENTFEPVIEYPSTYHEKFYGLIPWIYLPSGYFSPQEDRYFISFPLDPNIYIFNKDFKLVKTVDLSSAAIPKPIKPFKEKYTENYDYQKENQFYSLLSYYLDMLPDFEHNRVYRLALIKKADPNNPKSDPIISYTIVVCDSDLNILGEWEIPSKYDLSSPVLVNSQGLWLLDKEKTNPEETLLTFDIFDGKFKKT